MCGKPNKCLQYPRMYQLSEDLVIGESIFTCENLPLRTWDEHPLWLQIFLWGPRPCCFFGTFPAFLHQPS